MPAGHVHCYAFEDAGCCPHEAKCWLEEDVNIVLVYTPSTTTSGGKDCILGVAYLSKGLTIPNRMLKERQMPPVLSSGSLTSHGNSKSSVSLCAAASSLEGKKVLCLSRTLFVSSSSSPSTQKS